MVYLDDGTPYILEEDVPPMLSPEETAKRIETYTSSMTPKWETPKPALKTTPQAKFAAPQRANIWSRYIGKPQASERFGVINSGVIIPAMLLTGLNSDLPGYLIAQVSEPVYDSPTGTELLIPQGSRLFGEYDSKVTEFTYDAAYLRGCDRVLIAVDSSKNYISKTDKQIPEKQ